MMAWIGGDGTERPGRPSVLCFISSSQLFPAALSQWALLRLPPKVCMVYPVNSSSGPISLGTWMLRGGLWWRENKLEMFVRNWLKLYWLARPPSLLHSPPLLCLHMVWSAAVSAVIFTCMWPLHIPVNNHTPQHGYWIVPVKLGRSLVPIHWPFTSTNWSKGDVWAEQSVYGLSEIGLCLGVEDQHPPPHLSQPRPSTPLPPPLSSRVTVWPVFVCVCVCLFGLMAVTAPGRRRIFSGSWMPSRPSFGTCTGLRRSLPNTLRVASSSCRATWSRTASNGAFESLLMRGRQKQSYLRHQKFINAQNVCYLCA